MTKFDKEINEVTHCMYCGTNLVKVEDKPMKICPEGCLEILFIPENIIPEEKTKSKSKKQEEENEKDIKKVIDFFIDINKIDKGFKPEYPRCKGDMIS
jgi:hypothetical protein